MQLWLQISIFGDYFSKLFKSYLGEDAVYSFIDSMIEESEYCIDVMEKYFNKELVMTKQDNENFENVFERILDL